ncbi:hypothetical protein TRFO_25174 [Tritrichomonas foetus]|uniref:Myb-like DNA-binding domain containing protein n=1 Tax=Tritrichomonas foetus TaxID=1144522 RepID=A0A1J4K733_9EUKA|nr:hypothetical protein TRFO_25174 [Tritrichomonas foetus]|eukprot:OHT06712.1 hypothetical protein TRFO_25174 [Tritrichomonas foetus]
MPGRLAKQCRERWCNHLDPNIKRTSWTPEEDLIIIETIRKIGTKWADIARNLPGRTDNSVKNRWNSTLRRKKIEEIQSACENRNEQKNENIVSFELKCNIGINYASLNALMSSNVNPNISNPSNTNIRSDVHSNIHDVNSNMNGYDVGMYLNTEYSTSPITNRESNKSISGIDAHLFSSLNETSAGNGIGINMSYLMNKPHLCSENNNENILNNSRNNLLENRRRLSEMLELRKSQYIDSQTIC